ncbi:putative 3-phosphoshikimate 1-carboxyvinyltransferase [Rosellinia necatrix]|uniref:Putative 3-phosphoshikimate 1-carboxyvinyltransferase n=1 Tax=Rosellinia necatrix TaxID=77044 RepID=A0A1W2TT23_ROSNE|nr:putative 3-phosphoshikimate 1-carboxyvinyltransferase [Rosellinia necatrix]
MPHPFHPDDFPINTAAPLRPTRTFYLRSAIHFKTDAQIYELTGRLRQPWDGFSHAFLDETSALASSLRESGAAPTYAVGSCGNMMRTIKTMTDARGDKVCDLNITFVSFDLSTVRFPPGSPHSRHQVEMWPVGDKGDDDAKHEAFVRHSVPYFWDMTAGRVGVLYKGLSQRRVEIGRVAGFGFDKDAVLVLDGDELDDVVAISTCIILLNGRNAMDA